MMPYAYRQSFADMTNLSSLLGVAGRSMTAASAVAAATQGLAMAVAEMMTNACAMGPSSVMVRSIRAW